MIEIVQLLKELGSTAIDLFWLPVAIWTTIALLAAMLLKYFNEMAAVYQYHIRVAVLAALPAGIAAAPFIHWILSLNATKAAPALFIIQNPIPVAVTGTAQASITWSDPALWIGLATALIAAMAFVGIIKLVVHYVQLKIFIKQIKDQPAEQINPNITVYLSDTIQTPCTFGWNEKNIVIPIHLEEHREKFNMALQHELMHIQNNDYMINSFLQLIKALFYFHPSVHYFIRQADEYREIFCDTQVLSDATISQKSYAGLLYELAPKPIFKRSSAVNMAVNPSTLKKRIQMMKKQRHIKPSLKRSIIIALFLGLTLTGFMACSDMTSDGLTTTEVKKMQKKMATSSNSNLDKADPLYVLNGEIIDSRLMSRIKPKYIKSINVLKGEKAVNAYGEAGKNGVIELKVYNKEKVLSDLKSLEEVKNADLASIEMKVYLGADQMPKLKNRKEFYSHFNYPKKCKESGAEGTVYVKFVVTKAGDVTNAEVVQGINQSCDQAALALVKQHANFTPGMQDGQPVNVQMVIPVMYKQN